MGILSGKRVLITGGARGIGLAAGKAMVNEGAAVFLVDRDEKALAQALQSLREMGGRVDGFEGDISEWDQVERVFALADERGGPLNVLVNNAAIQFLEPLLDKDLETWERTLKVNLTGPFLCTKAFVRQVGPAGGVIINVVSALAFRPIDRYSDYVVSKAGLVALTKASALELAPLNIRVNALVPTVTRTELNRDVLADERLVKRIMERLLIKRIADPDDYAEAFLFLASDASRYMTGQVLFMDGGFLGT